MAKCENCHREARYQHHLCDLCQFGGDVECDAPYPASQPRVTADIAALRQQLADAEALLREWLDMPLATLEMWGGADDLLERTEALIAKVRP